MKNLGLTILGLIAPALTEAPADFDCKTLSKYSEQVYSGGDKVIYNNEVYQAKYYAGPEQGPDKAGTQWNKLGTCLPGTSGGKMFDCSVASPFIPGKEYGGDSKAVVHFKHEMYTQFQWSNDKEPSGMHWSHNGPCIPGTEGDGPTGPEVDCGTLHGWSGGMSYTNVPGPASIHYKGRLYKQKWWTQGDEPGGILDSTADPWEMLGKCKKGTDTLPPEKSGYEMTEEKRKKFCSCCKTCGLLQPNFIPKCMNQITKKEECFFLWCSDVKQDEKVCTDVLDSKVLLEYDDDLGQGKEHWPLPVYAPYMDCGLYPSPPLAEVSKATGIKHFVIAFIQSEKNGQGRCRGTWPGDTPIHVGPIMWDQKKQGNTYFFEYIKTLRDLDGDVAVSFGGALGVEIADSRGCRASTEADTITNVYNAYADVVNFLKLTRIDFDIEGGAIGSNNRASGWRYRFAAVKRLKQNFPNLNITWTLPILPDGLTEDGVNFLTDLVKSETPMANLNAMTMDYGGSNIGIDLNGQKVSCDDHMGDCELAAISTLAQQLLKALQSTGKMDFYGLRTLEDIYPMLGNTPMLGKNDITTETYTLKDAANSMQVWKTKMPIGFLSNWSLARDKPCPGKSYVDTACSSFNGQSSDYEFANIFKAITKP